MTNINEYIDHTNLKAQTTSEEIKKLCLEAIEYKFRAVCINSYFIPLANKILKDSSVSLCTVVGFPLGANNMETKRFETIWSLKNGAKEIDMVVNLNALKSGDHQYVLDDISTLTQICHQQGAILKVIFENCYLSDDEKKFLCDLCIKAKVDFVKTSTGFGTSGATISDILLMKAHLPDNIKTKASGGIKTKDFALELIDAGASRLGTSASIQIL